MDWFRAHVILIKPTVRAINSRPLRSMTREKGPERAERVERRAVSRKDAMSRRSKIIACLTDSGQVGLT